MTSPRKHRENPADRRCTGREYGQEPRSRKGASSLVGMLATGEGHQKPPSAPRSVNHNLEAPRTKLRTRTPLDGAVPEKPTDTEGWD